MHLKEREGFKFIRERYGELSKEAGRMGKGKGCDERIGKVAGFDREMKGQWEQLQFTKLN